MLNHQGTAVLKRGNLVLRPYITGDETAMFRNWASDEEVCRYLTWTPHADADQTRALVQDWASSYMSDCFYHWGITLDGELIGDIAVVRWSEANREAEIGYCLGRAWWGQGIMTRALKAVMHYLFDTVGFHRITLRHEAGNPASGRVMQKAGLRYEGTLAEATRRRDGTFCDLCVYGALKHTWPGAREDA